MNETQTHQIQLFKSVFKGREDVFAVRWENGKKSGYMPAYVYDPYMYRAHKMRGGTFQNYPDKTYLPYSDKEIAKERFVAPALKNEKRQPTKAIRYWADGGIKKVRTFNKDSGSLNNGFSEVPVSA